MADCKWHSSGDARARAADMMAGVDWSMGKKALRGMSPASTKLHTPASVLDSHQELYQAYLNKIIQSAQKTHGHHILKFEGEKGASINFKLLLEHAMAGLKRDHDTLAAEESDGDDRKMAIDSPVLGAAKLPPALEKEPSRDGKALRPPSLAATHPASYHHQTQHVQQTMLPPPSPKRIKLEPVIKQEPRSSPERSQPLNRHIWEEIHDPKALTNPYPFVHEPKYRNLTKDTLSDQPYVISPTPMIALPLGSLIEGATYWPAMETQLRDPQERMSHTQGSAPERPEPRSE